MKRCAGLVGLLVGSFACLLAVSAAASERHFTYTYETNVLNPGDIEIEPWQTLRAGRENFYLRYDLRLEFEVGVVENLQTALYWNFTSVTQDSVPEGATEEVRSEGFRFSGISNEWKYKLSDSVADPIGSGLYFEATAAPHEAELEAKVLLDKRIGPFLVAFNLVGEYEWEFAEAGETVGELILAPVAGLGYFFTPRVMAGVEIRNHTEWIEGDFEHSAFFAGPVVAYAADSWWTALTFMPQIATIKSHDHPGDSRLDLHDHEKLEVRLLLGMHVGGGGDHAPAIGPNALQP